MRRFIGTVLVLLTALVFAVPAVWAMGTARVTVITADGRDLPFNVEVARTPDEQAKGLMNRPRMDLDAGMIFDFGADRPITMWMKNTLIPLDMLFVTADGRISGIAQRTVPLSLDTIASPGPVRYVIELNGGTTDRLSIKPGDRVKTLPEVLGTR